MYEVGRRFLFLINKIENNTIHITQILNQNSSTTDSYSTTNGFENAGLPCLSGAASSSYFQDASINANMSTNDTFANTYDSSGAAKYIVVVVLVYGFAIIFFIGSQVRSTKKLGDEVDGVNAEKILRSMETEIFTKEVLEKLSNKEHREKAWKIYLAKPNPSPSTNSTTDLNSSRNSDTTITHKNQAIYDDENLMKEIDKSAVSSIEKKLKLLNKVQSNYKEADYKEAEIETVKEVLRPKPKSGTSGISKYKLFFKSKSSPKRKNPTVIQQILPHQTTPLLILQTDEEGLYKLKESKSRSKQPRQAQNNKRLLTTHPNENNYSTNKSRSLSTSDDASKHSCISFDACEISEKITSV